MTAVFIIGIVLIVLLGGVSLVKGQIGDTEVEIAAEANTFLGLLDDWDRDHPWKDRWNGHQITELRRQLREGEIQAWDYEYELDGLLAAEQPVIRRDTGVPTYDKLWIKPPQQLLEGTDSPFTKPQVERVKR